MVELTCMLLLTSLLSLIITLKYMYIFMYYFCLHKILRFHSTFVGSKTLDSAKWISYSIWRCNNLQIWENHINLYCFIVSPFYFKFKWTKKTNMFRHLYMHVNKLVKVCWKNFLIWKEIFYKKWYVSVIALPL